MFDANLITIPVTKLKPGMLVHQIGRQSGKLIVKSRGRLVHRAIVRQLINKGVETVVVEKPAAKKDNAISRFLPSHTLVTEPVTKPVIDNLGTPDESVLITTQHAYVGAAKLLDELKVTFKSIASRLKKDLPIQTSFIGETIDSVYAMLSSNKDALLFMTLFKQGDNYLYEHAVRCSILLCFFGQSLGFSEKDCKRLATIGYLFDVGMINVPSSIRLQRGRASLEDQLVLQTHVLESLSLLENVALDNEQRLAIEQHHERLDGSGYPFGAEGEHIHYFARMLAIVDCFDAMTSNREFKKPVTPASALKLLCNSVHGYDQKLAVQFLRAIGIYPCGSSVILDNNELAIVTEVLPQDPLKPIVQSVYSLTAMEHLAPKTIDLSETNGGVSIKKPALLNQFGLDGRSLVH